MNLDILEFGEILQMRKDIKLDAIKQLIESIANDEVYNAVSHFETDQEQKHNEYLDYIEKR